MLIHITPRFLLSDGYAHTVEALGLSIKELNLELRSESDIATRNPYSNKQWHVACRKIGRKAVSGILIRTDTTLSKYTCETKWLVNSERVITHVVEYKIADSDYAILSDDMLLWHKYKEYESRYPKEHLESDASPLEAQPRVEILAPGSKTIKKGWFEDHRRGTHLIKRTEVFPVPSIQIENYLEHIDLGFRFPLIEQAFS